MDYTPVINRSLLDMSIYDPQQDCRTPSPATITDLQSALSTLVSVLDEANRSVEPRFVDIGENLQLVYIGASELATEMAEATKLMGSDTEGSGINIANTLAHKSLELLQRNEENISRGLQDVELMAAHLSELRPWSEKLAKIAKRLRATSIYFAIEGSRTSDLAATFTAFTQELGQLADVIYGIACNIGADSRTSGDKQKAAQMLIYEETKHLHQLTNNTQNVVTTAVHEANAILELSLHALEQIGEHSQRLSQCVSSIVMAIQFHDITRQQVEHVVAALNDISDLCREAGDTDTGDPAEVNAALGRAHTTLIVQSAQIQSVITSIEDARNTIQSAFRDIAQESAEIASSVAYLAAGNSCESSGKDAFTKIRTALEDLCCLIERGQALSAKALDAAAQASDTTLQLSQYVHQISEINSELELKALNATIKSAHLANEGRSISVLAQEVVELSQMCSGFVTNMEEAIHSISQTAKESTDTHFDDTEDEGEMTADRLSHGIKNLATGCDEFLNCASTASEKSGRLQDMVAQTETRLDFLPELIGTLTESIGIITSMTDMLQPWANCTCADVDVIDNHAERYTMERERAIHGQALFGSTKKDGLAQPCNAENQSLEIFDDGLGDNVELF